MPGARARAETLIANRLQIAWKGMFSSLDELMITIDPRPGEAKPIVVGFSPIVIANLLGPIVEQIDVEDIPMADIDSWTTRSSSSRRVLTGSRLIEKSTDSIIASIMDGKGSAAITVKTVKPEFSNTNAKKIQLNDVLGPRLPIMGIRPMHIQRCQTAVELESGWLVTPATSFSYWRTSERLTKSTDLLPDSASSPMERRHNDRACCGRSIHGFHDHLQSAFWSGLEIVSERHMHTGYRTMVNLRVE